VVPRRQPEPRVGQLEQMTAYDIEKLKYYYDCGEFLHDYIGVI